MNGVKYALLPWRNERRLIELKKIVDSHTVGQISHFKIMSLNSKTQNLSEIIKREIDTAEYVGGLKVTEIFGSEKRRNLPPVMCMTDKKAVTTLELDATASRKRGNDR